MARKNDLDLLSERAAEAAVLLKLLANERRLLILCQLVAIGEAPAGQLGGLAGLSQSALSQHLAKLREQGLVATRRAARHVFYRVADPRVAQLLTTLRAIYCP